MIGSPLGKYEIIKTLGEGGYGQALLVKNKEDGQRYVMKKVRLTALKPKDREEALREAQVLSSLRCPNIVEYKESFQERGYFYIIMEFADGGDLAQKIKKRGKQLFSENEIMHDFIQIALAIKYIHDRKILHRDLKAQNVFLTKDGTVKLGDFGIARVLENTFQLCKTQIGTPYYLSPEMCEGKNYNSKTDIWSLGCILYELCTLKHPFDAANVNGLLMVIIRGKYQPISSYYSQNLKSLVQQLLTKDPAKRPSINQILGLPFIKVKLGSFLNPELLEYEMGHTILHGRKPFAAPTIVLSKQKDNRGTPPGRSRKIIVQPSSQKRTSPKQADRKKETERFRQMAKEMDSGRKKEEEQRKAEFELKKKREIEELKRQAEERERKKREAERRRILDEKMEREREEEERRRAAFDEEQRKKQEMEAERAREKEEQRQRNLAEIQKKKAAEAKRMAKQLKEQREQRLARIRMERAHAEEEEQLELERLREEDEQRSRDESRRSSSRVSDPDSEDEDQETEKKSLADSFVFRTQDSIPSWANGPTRHVSMDEDVDGQAASEPDDFHETLRVPSNRKKMKTSFEDTDVDERRQIFEENKRSLRQNRTKIRGSPILTPHRLASNDDIHSNEPDDLTSRERYELFKQQREERKQNQIKISGDSPKRGSPRLLLKDELLGKGSAGERSNMETSIRDALALPSFDEDGEAEPGFEAENGGKIGYADNKELHFPVAHDEESRQYRAEELRAYLIRKIGREKLLKVFAEIRLYDEMDEAETPVCNSLEPEIVIMAQQLMYLEHND